MNLNLTAFSSRRTPHPWIDAAITIQTERLEVAQGLVERGTSSRAAFLDVQDAFTSLEKEREVYLRELSQKQSQETALLAERRSIITGQLNQLFQRRAEIEARLAVLQVQSRTAERRVIAALLLSPVDGIVDQLEVYTIGAVSLHAQRPTFCSAADFIRAAIERGITRQFQTDLSLRPDRTRRSRTKLTLG